MVLVTYTGKALTQFAGKVWKPKQEDEIENPRHLNYYRRHADFKVAGSGKANASTSKDVKAAIGVKVAVKKKA